MAGYVIIEDITNIYKPLLFFLEISAIITDATHKPFSFFFVYCCIILSIRVQIKMINDVLSVM